MAVSRRRFFALTGLAAGLLATPSNRALRSSLSRHEGRAPMYVGTYSGGESKGIYHCAFGPTSGRIQIIGATSGIANPSFLAADPRGRRLFAVSETAEFEGKPGGGVYAFAIDRNSGDLSFLNALPSHGADPAHLTVDNRGRFVLVANYTGGNVCVFPVGDDGRLQPRVADIRHVGRGPDPKRQKRPHAHSVTLDPANRRAFAADLGIDRVMVYIFNGESGALTPAEQPEVLLKPGAGPRHLDFSPDGNTVYVLNELDSTVATLSYDPDTGSLEVTHTVSALPPSFTGENTCADVHAHPSGRFVYASNRGHDSITVFSVERGGKRLTPIQHQSTLGRSPRNFAIDPTGRFLLAANQRSGTIVVLKIDSMDGTLSPTGEMVSLPSPVCIRFVGEG